MLNEDRAIQSPRMRRKLFNLATAISLVLCVGAVALWVRSYSFVDDMGWNSKSGTRMGLSYRGGSIAVFWNTMALPRRPGFFRLARERPQSLWPKVIHYEPKKPANGLESRAVIPITANCSNNRISTR